jgi:DNA-binding MarR family transcriptional regulator
MADEMKTDETRIAARKAREDTNIFSRLPTVYAASRKQGQHLLQRGGGLSIVEWRVLWDLHEAGPMTIGDLAQIQRADHSLLSRALPEMRRKGFVKTLKDQRDGRQMLVALAPEGKAAYERAAPIMARRRAALKEVFTPQEIASFAGFLDRLEDFLRQPVEDIAQTQEKAE